MIVPLTLQQTQTFGLNLWLNSSDPNFYLVWFILFNLSVSTCMTIEKSNLFRVLLKAMLRLVCSFDLRFLLTWLCLIGLFFLFCSLLVRMDQSRKLLIDLCHCSFACMVKLAKRLVWRTLQWFDWFHTALAREIDLHLTLWLDHVIREEFSPFVQRILSVT